MIKRQGGKMKGLFMLSMITLALLAYFSLSKNRREEIQEKSKEYIESSGISLDDILEDIRIGKEWAEEKVESFHESKIDVNHLGLMRKFAETFND